MYEMRREIIHLGMRQLFVMLAVPGIIGTLILGLYNFVDGIFVGQLIGPQALGGVTLVYSIVLINQAILTLIGMGSMALLSIAVGKQGFDTINQLFGNLFINQQFSHIIPGAGKGLESLRDLFVATNCLIYSAIDDFT